MKFNVSKLIHRYHYILLHLLLQNLFSFSTHILSSQECRLMAMECLHLTTRAPVYYYFLSWSIHGHHGHRDQVELDMLRVLTSIFLLGSLPFDMQVKYTLTPWQDSQIDVKSPIQFTTFSLCFLSHEQHPDFINTRICLCSIQMT